MPPQPQPRLNRWPGPAAVATAIGLEISAAWRGGPAMISVLAGFMLAFGLTLAIDVAGMRRR